LKRIFKKLKNKNAKVPRKLKINANDSDTVSGHSLTSSFSSNKNEISRNKEIFLMKLFSILDCKIKKQKMDFWLPLRVFCNQK